VAQSGLTASFGEEHIIAGSETTLSGSHPTADNSNSIPNTQHQTSGCFDSALIAQPETAGSQLVANPKVPLFVRPD
jgi:hypothetical protein